MTRNLFVLYDKSDIELLYANGITFRPKHLNQYSTLAEVSKVLRDAGYVEPGDRCNPEVLSYVVVITEYAKGLLMFCSIDEEDI